MVTESPTPFPLVLIMTAPTLWKVEQPRQAIADPSYEIGGRQGDYQSTDSIRRDWIPRDPSVGGFLVTRTTLAHSHTLV